MKIGIFLDEWAQGGVPVFLERLEKNLTAQGHYVVFFLLRPHNKRDRIARDLYGKLKEKLQDRCVSLDLDCYPRQWRKSHLYGTILKSGVECLIINQFRDSIQYLQDIADRVPLISISHTDSDYYYHEFLLTEQITAAHVAVSEAIHRRCVAFAAPERGNRIHRIPYGVEHGDLFITEPQGPPVIIYCARLDALQKRCHDLVPIWEKYRAQGGQGVLQVIGTGTSEAYLLSALKSHIQQGSVVFHRHLYARDVPSVMSQGDIILNISNYEGLPQTVMEGACLGLYPLLSDIDSGHREIVETLQTGTLCRLGDVGAFVHELLRLERDLPSLRLQRKAVRAKALQHYNVEECAHRYAAVIKSVRVISQQDRNVENYRPSLKERASRTILRAKYRRYFPA